MIWYRTKTRPPSTTKHMCELIWRLVRANGWQIRWSPARDERRERVREGSKRKESKGKQKRGTRRVAMWKSHDDGWCIARLDEQMEPCCSH
ncbi:hypothetical protein MPTK1_7g03780 [Marchantia polymorpha subsp. ruderalis]|uniref:Uncharacterized protein n=2 Tax=Marchantia polymorpha TaxID=3197 RepID=A0AAF6BVV8_MARPO|nr:hypothetical protein MARPO_0074s0019 [Marchantia polymorpha]BBN16142.1 hypothetical protein Mp_7g03780 [Marchantia polymorpha subsp. ruderalis]|eukprot:PTQ35023.1 hypothetical protein MARPO_0074s0019 [Marchantia polymorpha]